MTFKNEWANMDTYLTIEIFQMVCREVTLRTHEQFPKVDISNGRRNCILDHKRLVTTIGLCFQPACQNIFFLDGPII